MAYCVQQFSSLSQSADYFFAIINMVVAVVAFTGNLLVFVVIWQTPSLRNRSICCIVSLAMTDFLVGLILEPLHIIQFLFQDYRINCTFNSVRRIFAVVLIGASISSIGFISYDRYILLSKTKNYAENMSWRKIVLALFIAWSVPLFMPFIRVIWDNEKVYGTMILFYGPTYYIIMLVCYISIIKLVKTSEQQMKCHVDFGMRRQARGMRYHVKAAKVVSIVIICFFITTMPISIYMGMSGISLIISKEIQGFTGENRDIFYAFAMTFAMVGSAVNPIIYYARNPGFKERFMQILKDRFTCLFSRSRTPSQRRPRGLSQISSQVSSDFSSGVYIVRTVADENPADSSRDDQVSRHSLCPKMACCKQSVTCTFLSCLTFEKRVRQDMPHLSVTNSIYMKPIAL